MTKATKQSTKLQAVIADDDGDILAMVSQHFRSQGIKVIEATDGEQAFAAVEKHHPDFVVLDVMMPGLSGWEVCKRIRENASIKGTPVLMLTAIGERLNEMTSPLYGADDYLDKPFEFSDLDKKVKAMLAAKKKTK